MSAHAESAGSKATTRTRFSASPMPNGMWYGKYNIGLFSGGRKAVLDRGAIALCSSSKHWAIFKFWGSVWRTAAFCRVSGVACVGTAYTRFDHGGRKCHYVAPHVVRVEEWRPASAQEARVQQRTAPLFLSAAFLGAANAHPRTRSSRCAKASAKGRPRGFQEEASFISRSRSASRMPRTWEK